MRKNSKSFPDIHRGDINPHCRIHHEETDKKDNNAVVQKTRKVTDMRLQSIFNGFSEVLP